MVGAFQSLEEHSAPIIGAEIFTVSSVGNMILWNEVSTYRTKMPCHFPGDHNFKDECCYFCLCDVVQVEVTEENIHN